MNLSRTSFPQRYLFLLVHIKGLLKGFGKKYYSQGGEDAVLQHIFSNKKNGFYVDVGANHPMHYSNTYLLYKRGWSGINIDPNPASIKLFNWHRRRDCNINCGIAEEATKKEYYMFNHQSCNTFSKKQEEILSSNLYLFTPSQYKLASLNSKIKVDLKQPPSELFLPFIEYLNLGDFSGNWQNIGVQGITDFIARINQDNHSELLLKALPIFSRWQAPEYSIYNPKASNAIYLLKS